MSSKGTAEAGPRGGSLAARLTAWYGGSAFLLIAGATGFLYWGLVTNLDREDDEFLADKVHLVRTLLHERPADPRRLEEEVQWEPAARRYVQVYLRVQGPGGQVILETPGMSAILPPARFPSPAAADGEAFPGHEVVADGRSFRIVAAGESPAGAAPVIQVALDRTREEDLLARYRHNLWWALAAALVVCVAVGYQVARRGLRPVAQITAAARRIRSTTLHERLRAGQFPAELSLLAATFNEMLDRLQEAFDRLERFAADIAHELRTPVNNLRGEAEVALGQPRSPEEYREVLGSCLEEYGRLSRIIDNLLFLARAEDPKAQVAQERLDVGRELATVQAFYEAAAEEAGVALVVQAPDGLVALLDRTLFQRALGNLITNALAHTPPGGTVTLAASREQGAVCVDVADTGGGIAPEHLPHVFDRFYRADPARPTGAGRVGLGLALVKSIASLHHGSVTIASTAGQGTRVRLLFPEEPPGELGAPSGLPVETLHP